MKIIKGEFGGMFRYETFTMTVEADRVRQKVRRFLFARRRRPWDLLAVEHAVQEKWNA